MNDLERHRKKKTAKFFERADIKAQIDDAFKPPAHRAFSEDAGHGVTIRYRRPDGSVTGPKPHVVPSPAPKSSKVGTAVAIGAGTAAVGGLYALNRKQTKGIRQAKKRIKKSAFGVEHTWVP